MTYFYGNMLLCNNRSMHNEQNYSSQEPASLVEVFLVP